MAEDSAAWAAEDAIRAGSPMTPEQMEERSRFYLARIPYKLTKMRYSSFTSYFSRLIKLGWVERTGKMEPSEAQEDWPHARPHIYYRLTQKGKAAPPHEWSDPFWPAYQYPREKRSAKKRRLYHIPPRQRRRPRAAPRPKVPPPQPTPLVKVPAFQLPDRPGRGAAQRLIKHLRRLGEMDPEAPQVQAEMERPESEMEGGIDQVAEALPAGGEEGAERGPPGTTPGAARGSGEGAGGSGGPGDRGRH